MADTKDPSKAVIKGARRASFARALHVSAIGRRKQVQIVEHTQRNSSSSREHVENTPQRLSSPQPATIPNDTLQLGNYDDEGAEIPDIPLRRFPNTKRPNIDYSGSRLATLERMLAEGGPQELSNDRHFDPIDPKPQVSRGSTRYSAQLTAFWEPPLLPQPRDSRERSLSNVPETSPPPSIRRGPGTSSDLLEPPLLPPWRESHSAPVSTAGSIVSSEDGLSPVAYPRSSHDRATIESSKGSISLQTDLASPLPALQTKGADEACDALEPVAEEDVEPGSFDLVVPATNLALYNLERRSELLFSVAHLRVIFDDPLLLHRFTNFVSIYRPWSVPLLRYYLNALKAIRAMEWVNSTISKCLRLDGYEFAAKGPPQSTENKSLREMSEAAFEALARDELPAYITHVWTEIVEMSIKRRITGTLPAHLHDMSDGLAEVFCITDPSRTDNPIVFSSEGRNCRFLQGPKTNPFAIKRIRENLEQGKVHYETFLNYRRDGSPFMNLLMCAPLMDSTGTIRYFLGAQIDVSGLAKGCSGLESLRRLVDQNDEEHKIGLHAHEMQEDHTKGGHRRQDSGTEGGGSSGAPSANTGTTTSTARVGPRPVEKEEEDEFRLLCEILNGQELETARRFGGRMHRSQQEQVQHLESISNWHKRRVVIQDSSENSPPATPRRQQQQQQHDGTEPHGFSANFTTGPPWTPTTSASPPQPPSAPAAPTPTLRTPRAPTTYENYLVVRPYPSLRILFASPSLRVPGILQSHLMGRIGGSRRIHEELEQAFALGQGVTAKVKWITGGGGAARLLGGDAGRGEGGRPRWIHCTPLIGSNGSVGVWVVVIVDEEESATATEPDDGGGGGGGRRRQQRRGEVSSPTFNSRGAGGGSGGPANHHHHHHHHHHQPAADKRRDRDSSLWDSMSLTDFAAMNSLPEDEDLRQHVRDMFGEGRADGGSDLVGFRAAELRRGDGIGSAGGGGGSRSSSPFTLGVGELP
ncbi:hypothetical protein VMCG_02820 [Cytospora schulzeri]|uniref:PAC domain-containing protein n=1 Tax=Cytospora schulzeri TaxID=448051 RepID=A0A423WZK3_9PEZI|nr:hypothetical protein VMCG_02820 [Valsa malicola]